MIRELQIYGPVSGPTGYDTFVRGLLKALYRMGVTVKLHPFQGWSSCLVKLDKNTHDMLTSMINVKLFKSSAPLVHICLPEQVKPIENCYNVNYTMFEVNKIPKNWVEASMDIDLIVLPASFLVETWSRSGVPGAKIEKVPLGVDTEIFYPDVEPLGIVDQGTKIPLTDYKNRVMTILEVTSRKNLKGLLRVFYRVAKSGDTCLIIKSSSYSHSNSVETMVEEVKGEFKAVGAKEFPPVYVYRQILPVYKMANFISLCTHYFSLSFGEGFDIAALQAGAMGKCLVVPTHSGYSEWVREEDCFSIRIQGTAPAFQGKGLQRLYEGGEWYLPDEVDAQEKLHSALYGDPQVVKERSEKLRKRIAENYTWQNTAEKLISIIEDRVSSKKTIVSKVEELRLAVSVPSLGRRCGIADYSHYLANELGRYVPVEAIGGKTLGYLDFVDRYKPTVVHFQIEYQFFSPNRLSILYHELNKRGIKTVTTLHTVNPSTYEHNKVVTELSDVVLVHCEKAKKVLNSDNVLVMPMGCKVEVNSPKKRITREMLKIGNKKLIGTFGFCYFHKGIKDLILALDELESCALLIISLQPLQDVLGYYQQCKELVKLSKKKIMWFCRFVSEERVVQLLSECDLIVLPYSEYGGIGTSAGVRTCMLAKKPILVSDTSFFSDVPSDVVYKYSGDLVKGIKGAFEVANGWESGFVNDFLRENSWENVAKKHLNVYYGKEVRRW